MQGIPSFLHLPPLSAHSTREEADHYCPQVDRSGGYDPGLNSACTTENLNSALGQATNRAAGTFPVWLMAHTGLFP